MPSRRRAHLGLSAPTRSSRCFRSDTLLRNVMLSLLGSRKLRWNPSYSLDRRAVSSKGAQDALARVGLAHLAERPLSERPMASGAGSRSPWR